jgi:hypothetical protein
VVEDRGVEVEGRPGKQKLEKQKLEKQKLEKQKSKKLVPQWKTPC